MTRALLFLAGAALVVAGIYLVSLPAALVVAGVTLCGLAGLWERAAARSEEAGS